MNQTVLSIPACTWTWIDHIRAKEEEEEEGAQWMERGRSPVKIRCIFVRGTNLNYFSINRGKLLRIVDFLANSLKKVEKNAWNFFYGDWNFSCP
jgi:hypothetical protein